MEARVFADEQAAAEAAAAIIAAAARAAVAERGRFVLAVHLGLGPDGHTASLVPGDPVNQVTDRDVALTGVYQGQLVAMTTSIFGEHAATPARL